MGKKFDIPEDEYVLDRRVLPNMSENSPIPIADIPVSKIVCDEENEEICGSFTQEDIDSLACDIQEDGFKGTIMAYPIKNEEGDEVYRIESGHKRFLAAKQAGLKKIPVNVTKPPKTEAERRYRLINMNLHLREHLKPSEQSKRIIYMWESTRQMREEAGFPANTSVLLPIMARKFVCSEQSIAKYRQFSNLVPSLQKLADEGVSWSAIVQCSTLPQEKQENIAFFINNEVKRVGVENVSRPWVLKLIQKTKHQLSSEDEMIIPPRTALKRRDGAKLIARCARDMEDIISDNIFIRDTNRDEAVKNLKNIRTLIDQKLSELEEC